MFMNNYFNMISIKFSTEDSKGKIFREWLVTISKKRKSQFVLQYVKLGT